MHEMSLMSDLLGKATKVVEDAGVPFLLRSASSLRRKAADKKGRAGKRDRNFNPFLPPEPELTLGAISQTHTAVLNKFNVLEQHLLIVTRDFEHQETLLSEADFHALWLALGEIDGLGFYNGGAEAGAILQLGARRRSARSQRSRLE